MPPEWSDAAASAYLLLLAGFRLGAFLLLLVALAILALSALLLLRRRALLLLCHFTHSKCRTIFGIVITSYTWIGFS